MSKIDYQDLSAKIMDNIGGVKNVKTVTPVSYTHLYTNEKGERKQKWETYETKAEAKRRKKEIEYKKEMGSFVAVSYTHLIEGMKQAQGITEQLKAENALEWTGCLNNIRACAREIVEKEIIFA